MTINEQLEKRVRDEALPEQMRYLTQGARRALGADHLLLIARMRKGGGTIDLMNYDAVDKLSHAEEATAMISMLAKMLDEMLDNLCGGKLSLRLVDQHGNVVPLPEPQERGVMEIDP